MEPGGVPLGRSTFVRSTVLSRWVVLGTLLNYLALLLPVPGTNSIDTRYPSEPQNSPKATRHKTYIVIFPSFDLLRGRVDSHISPPESAMTEHAKPTERELAFAAPLEKENSQRAVSPGVFDTRRPEPGPRKPIADHFPFSQPVRSKITLC